MRIFFLLNIIFFFYKLYSSELEKESEYIIPRIIWLFWDGEIHNITRSLIHSIKQNVNTYEIIMLNSNTVNNYIRNASNSSKFNDLMIQIKADYFRFSLLYEYGGIWLDATTYIENDDFLNQKVIELNEKKGELLVYNYLFHPSNNIEISCLFASKNSRFIQLILKEFSKGIEMGRMNYMEEKIQIQNVEIRNKKIYNPEKNPRERKYNVYFFVNVCIQYVLQKKYNNNANIIIKRAEDELFKFQMDCNWNTTIMENKWKNDSDTKSYPIIKFTYSMRSKIRIPVDNIKII